LVNTHHTTPVYQIPIDILYPVETVEDTIVNLDEFSTYNQKGSPKKMARMTWQIAVFSILTLWVCMKTVLFLKKHPL